MTSLLFGLVAAVLVPLEFDFATAIGSLETGMITNIGIGITAGIAVAVVLWGVRAGLRAMKSVAK